MKLSTLNKFEHGRQFLCDGRIAELGYRANKDSGKRAISE